MLQRLRRAQRHCTHKTRAVSPLTTCPSQAFRRDVEAPPMSPHPTRPSRPPGPSPLEKQQFPRMYPLTFRTVLKGGTSGSPCNRHFGQVGLTLARSKSFFASLHKASLYNTLRVFCPGRRRLLRRRRGHGKSNWAAHSAQLASSRSRSSVRC